MQRLLVSTLALLLLAACFDFDGAYNRFCASEHCDGGSGGGAGGGAGGGGTGGGKDGGAGGGGTGGGLGGGAGGGSAGGAGGGGTGGGDAGTDAGVDAGVFTCDAGQLCFVRSYDTPKKVLQSVWAATPNEVWAAGDQGTVVRWNGAAFTPMLLPQTSGNQYALWGTSPADVWAVGSPGSITHRWNGSTWIPITTPGSYSSYGVVAFSPSSALMITYASEILSWNGTAWAHGPLDSSPSYYGLTACTPDEAWVSTGDGRVFRYQADAGTVALEYTAPGTPSLNALFCSPTEGVWVVGGSGTVARRQAGGVWTTLPTGNAASLNSIWISPQGTVWLAGDNRTLLRLTDAGVEPFNLPPYNLGFYSDVFGVGDDLWVSGGYSQVAGFDGGVMIQYRVGN